MVRVLAFVLGLCIVSEEANHKPNDSFPVLEPRSDVFGLTPGGIHEGPKTHRDEIVYVHESFPVDDGITENS